MNKKDKERADKDIRPIFFTKNYDYGEPGLGTGLYRGPMDRYKSVSDFLNKSRKRRQRKKKLLDVAKGLSLQQIKTAANIIPLFKPKHIDPYCQFCPEDTILQYDPKEDLWICPECTYEYEDNPHQEGEGLFDIDELDPFTKKRFDD